MAPEKIIEALHQLDPENDEHWTKGGWPQVVAVEAILGEAVTRNDINAAAPDFTRESITDDSSDDDSAVDAPMSLADRKAAAQAKVTKCNEARAAADAAYQQATRELDSILIEESKAPRKSQAELVQLRVKRDGERHAAQMERQKQLDAFLKQAGQ